MVDNLNNLVLSQLLRKKSQVFSALDLGIKPAKLQGEGGVLGQGLAQKRHAS